MNLEPTRNWLKQAGLKPGLEGVCFQVADLLEDLTQDTGSFLTFAFFEQAVKKKEDQEQLWAALTLLSTSAAPALKAHGYLNTEDGPLILSDEDFFEFSLSGELVHPEDGKPLDSPREHVHLFFSVNEKVRK
ncbi:hypothetical protein Q4578_06820 [Shimia thalassica]|uniref:hypothetical protein n=1 Tax=Shimia thalassica TaxID=1715693 RepID=UPI0026E3C185|nr:hypothetical protein [Shimia thalassica]MDO6521292.1 hypothetical protein [Shimia thalassica]